MDAETLAAVLERLRNHVSREINTNGPIAKGRITGLGDAIAIVERLIAEA